MFLYDLKCFCNGILLLMAAVTAIAVYTYYVDAKRPDDDPKKKHYHPLAILLAPVTFPLFVVFYTSLFILRVVTYAVFLVLFIVAMIFIRQPAITEGLKKNATAIGDRLLDGNTQLIRIFLRPWAGSRGSP